MAFRRYVIPIVVFVAVVGVALATITIADAARADGGVVEDQVTNETIVQEVGIWQYVNVALEDDTAGFNDSVTVYNASGDELTAGVDYEWNATDGTITYFNTQNVTDGSTGNITYTYERNTQPVNVLSTIIDPIVGFVSWSPLMVAGLGLGILLLAAAAFVSKTVGKSESVTRNR